jgi:predicted aminopeptidase
MRLSCLSLLAKKLPFAVFGLSFLMSLCGCQIGYIVNNGYEQAKLLNSRVPIKDILKDPKVDDTTKAKLSLAMEAKDFAQNRLHLKATKNYNSYVDLKRPYVTYIVSAAPKNELKFYTWYFPIIGSVPYKGYFAQAGADHEAQGLAKEGYDVYVRGVSAYSTLGWFNDPVLSSMVRYSDYDLVNTIIHETVHATLYISSNANFNERLATFLGDLGARLFYQEKRPNELKSLDEVHLEDNDQRIFSIYISEQIKNLEKWYAEHAKDADLITAREEQFKKIKEVFSKDILPQMKTDKYNSFSSVTLNNAKLMGYKLYMNDLGDFEKLSQIFNNDYEKILNYCRSLAKSKNPEETLKAFISRPPEGLPPKSP